MRMCLFMTTILGSLTVILSHVTFTNLKCATKDIKFANFSKCYIKAVNRTHKYMDLHVNLYQKNVDNVTVKVKLMRQDHGFKPFLVDVTIDACKFLKNQRQPMVKMLFDMYKRSSNLNHTCPYNHDIIVDHLWTGHLEGDVLKYIPLKYGDYAIFSEWSAYNTVRAIVNIYIRLSETIK
ncbi:uncharacterized protein LOC108034427 [Drosophila biarmipes]|uniref:uncharacterized protein LOC108034427 n=1 Tax=Drosophila biarmipes TaxID=125945 RepID=UPI0007E880A5|nr:uncharacterized protein LOC108034427 [Drosophila biarmipes]